MRFSNIFFALISIACNGPEKAAETNVDTIQNVRPIQDGTYVADSVAVPIDTTQKINAVPISNEPAENANDEEETADQKKINSPKGIYQTVLPCYNCKGINHTVSFYTNLSYRIEEEKQETEKSLTATTGYWRPTGNTIWLYKDQIVKARYTWQGDTLMYIEPKTNELIPLKKLNSAAENNQWVKKKKEGAAFFGVGNEPFWNIEIRNNESVLFHLADWQLPKNFIPSDPEYFRDSIIYKATADSAQLKITIYNAFCSDGMSDNIYDNAVKVAYKNKIYKGCGILF